MNFDIKIGDLYQTRQGPACLVLSVSKHKQEWKKKVLVLITGHSEPVWIMQSHFYQIIN